MHIYFTITVYMTPHSRRLNLGIYCHMDFKFHSENLQFLPGYIK